MTAGDGLDVLRRRQRFALLMAAPAIVVALVLCGIGGWRAASLSGPPAPSSLGDAIEQGDLVQAYQFIRGGQDANALISVRHPALTGGQAVLTSPVMWATALRQPHAVQTLLAFGASLERPQNRNAICLAQALRDEETVRVLRTFAGSEPRECGEIAAGESPLLKFSNEAR
jgi:hypothetical protein